MTRSRTGGITRGAAGNAGIDGRRDKSCVVLCGETFAHCCVYICHYKHLIPTFFVCLLHGWRHHGARQVKPRAGGAQDRGSKCQRWF